MIDAAEHAKLKIENIFLRAQVAQLLRLTAPLPKTAAAA
jgi:hypothetical protein